MCNQDVYQLLFKDLKIVETDRMGIELNEIISACIYETFLRILLQIII